MNNPKPPTTSEPPCWRSIICVIEARSKELKLGITEETTVSDVIKTVEEGCQNEGTNIADWKKRKTGNANANLVLIRKKGYVILPPTCVFGSLSYLENDEYFDVQADARVG